MEQIMKLRCLYHPTMLDPFTFILGRAERGKANFIAMNRDGDYYHGECDTSWIKAQNRRRLPIAAMPDGPIRTLRSLGYLAA
jgi:hypothetical protein